MNDGSTADPADAEPLDAPAPVPDRSRSPMVLEHWKVTRLIPYAGNPRQNDDAVHQMVAVLREFGFRYPILARSSGEIIDGHLRVKAAYRLGWATVPVLLADDLSEEQIRAFRLVVNRSASWAKWDDELLARELRALEATDFDLWLTGFEADELHRLLQGELRTQGADPEAVPELEAQPISAAGDLWTFGEHRLLCGDATAGGDVDRLLAGRSPFLMVTDPPYGVSYDPRWRNREGLGQSKRTGDVANDHRHDWSAAWSLFPGAIAYVWHGATFASQVQRSLERYGFQVRTQIVWAKRKAAIGRGHYHWQHECAWYAVRRGTPAKWNGGRAQTTLWDVEAHEADVETIHATQKPVAVMRRPIANHGSIRDAVYEPFGGSGTTFIAAELEGRPCLGIELRPLYVDLIVRRWQRFTGLAARLDGGPTFQEVEAERAGATG